jgi:hypothetical protein
MVDYIAQRLDLTSDLASFLARLTVAPGGN